VLYGIRKYKKPMTKHTSSMTCMLTSCQLPSNRLQIALKLVFKLSLHGTIAPHLPFSFVKVDMAIPQSCNRPAAAAAEIRHVIQRTAENPDFRTLIMQI
jgi:hypothetical protein